MSRFLRFPLNLVVVAIGIVIAAAAWYLGSPLFLDDVVDEALPFEIPSAEELDAMPAEKRDAMEAEMMATAAAMPPLMTNDPMPGGSGESGSGGDDAGPTILSSGDFAGADDFHMGSGTATIYGSGEDRILRLENFTSTNGPDLHVLLSVMPSPTKEDILVEYYVDLGSLKGNIGNQNYAIPEDVDLRVIESVVIYCMPFHVVFSTAELR